MARSMASCSVVLILLVAGCGTTAPERPPSPRPSTSWPRQSLAQIEGELDVPGLQRARRGHPRPAGHPPHLRAEHRDLFFAQGYVTAQDRLWQMEMWRRWHEGRLAEIYGPEAFDYDARTRLMMFRGPWDAAEWTSYHPEGEAIFTAFADGVNAFIEENADNLPVEFKLTGVRPAPWTAQTVVLRWAQIALSSVRGHAINEMQLARNVARFGARKPTAAQRGPFRGAGGPAGPRRDAHHRRGAGGGGAGDGDPFTGDLPPLEIVEPYRPW